MGPNEGTKNWEPFNKADFICLKQFLVCNYVQHVNIKSFCLYQGFTSRIFFYQSDPYDWIKLISKKIQKASKLPFHEVIAIFLINYFHSKPSFLHFTANQTIGCLFLCKNIVLFKRKFRSLSLLNKLKLV